MKLLRFLLICLAVSANAADITGSVLIDFEGGANGNVVTPSILAASVKGSSLGTWACEYGSTDASGTVGNSPFLTLSASAGHALRSSANIDGTVYTGAGTLGLRAVMTPETNSAVKLTFTTPQPNLSLGFFFRFNGDPVDFSPRDLVVMQDISGHFQVLQIYDQASGDMVPYFHTHFQGGAGVGNNVDFQRNTWYWVTILRGTAASPTMRISFYETSGYTLLGESTGTVSVSTTDCIFLELGAFKYSVDGQSVDYDSLVINTSGVYPLGPGDAATPAEPPAATGAIRVGTLRVIGRE